MDFEPKVAIIRLRFDMRLRKLLRAPCLEALIIVSLLFPSHIWAQAAEVIPVSGDTRYVHDPSIIKEGDTWYLFGTANGPNRDGELPIRCSKDLPHWARCGSVFTHVPEWIQKESRAFRLFENPGNGNDWINVKLIGAKSNRSAIGARIKVTVDSQGSIRSIYRTVGSGGSFGASPLEQHIGLGKSARIRDLEIWWPTSNTRQHFANIAANQFIEIKEFATSYKRLERKAVHLGGPKKDHTPSQQNSAASSLGH
jgi:hypothetical protein